MLTEISRSNLSCWCVLNRINLLLNHMQTVHVYAVITTIGMPCNTCSILKIALALYIATPKGSLVGLYNPLCLLIVTYSLKLNSTNNCSGLGKGCWSTSKTDFTRVNLIAANANALIRLNYGNYWQPILNTLPFLVPPGWRGKSFVFPE